MSICFITWSGQKGIHANALVWSAPFLQSLVSFLSLLSGLLILGGTIANTNVELWSPGRNGVQCRLPDLPESVIHPSLESILVGDSDAHWFTIACDSGTCLRFKQGNWEFHRKTLLTGWGHTSAVFYNNSHDGNILLAGGFHPDEKRLAEIIPDDQDPEADVSTGFRLKHDRYYSCSIQLDQEGFILTGGLLGNSFPGNSREVTEYSFQEPDGNPHDLPPLSVERHSHACGSYQDNVRGSKVILFYNTALSHYFLRC